MRDSYGKVTYYRLEDAKNLEYIPSHSKRISVYTPPSYSNKTKYPLLVMFDGQNLYAKAEGRVPNQDGYGSWNIDGIITKFDIEDNKGVIVVAIDNSDGYRDSELTMRLSFGEWSGLENSEAFLNGKLDELGDFISQTALPFVKENYSVDDNKIGIIGASSGGLASYYLGLRDNDIYRCIGAFSPANALFTVNAWHNYYENMALKNQPRIYVYCGYNDFWENQLIDGAKQIKDIIKYGYAPENIKERYIEDALHNEAFWRNVFPDFLEYFLNKK